MRRDARFGQILDAAARVFSERGYHGATMREVAREAGASLAKLYRYIGNKEDLLYQVQRRILEAAVASAQAALAARSTRERLRSLVTDHVRRVMARPYEADVIRGAPSPLPDGQQKRVDELRKRYLSLVRAAADAAVRAPGGKRKDAEQRTTLLLGMADRVALEAAWQSPRARPDRLATPILQLFLAGAAGKPKRKAARRRT